jgi:hypothetical protein
MEREQSLSSWSVTLTINFSFSYFYPGDFKLVALPRGKKERTQLTFQETGARRALNFGDYPADSLWKKCKHVVSESLDECFVGSWAFAQSATDDSEVRQSLIYIIVFVLNLHQHSAVISGRITEILCAVSDLSVVVLLEVFQVLSSRDPVYGMPVLVRRNSETTLMIIPSKVCSLFLYAAGPS